MDFETFYQEVSREVIRALNSARTSTPLHLSTSFELGHKTVSEIGGRFIEEYVTQILSISFERNSSFKFELLPSRSLGDFRIESRKDSGLVLYVDIKAQHLTIREETEKYYRANKIKQKKPGESHPNLISYEKAIDFYGDVSRSKEDIAILLVKYEPKINSLTVNFEIKEFLVDSLFLLRKLSEINLSFGMLGKGQIQLSRINAINFTNRSKSDFLAIIQSIAQRPRATRRTSKA